MKEIALVYPVAGLSSRFQGKIKQLVIVGPNNESLIEYSIKQALQAGFTKIIFIVGEKTEQPFKELFKDNYKGIPIEYTKQAFNPEERDKPWGTIDALCTLLQIIKTPFITCNGDDLYGKEAFQILANHLKQNPNQNAAIGYKLSNTFEGTEKGNRAIFQIDKNNNVQKITETFDIEKNNYQKTNTKPDDLVSMNIWALTPQTLKLLNQQLNKFKLQNKTSRTAECLLSNELSNLIQEGKLTMKLYPTNTATIGITYPGDEEKTRKLLASQSKL